MKLSIAILLLLSIIACSNHSEKKNSPAKSNQSNQLENNTILLDTMTTTFSVQIGNDKGLVEIVSERAFQNEKIVSSKFIISLKEIQDYSITKIIDKSALIDNNDSVLFIDTINSDYMERAIIRNIAFEGVRANTLYFTAILDNPLSNKEILGRFNLFYRTKKKGTVYGWITDEIKRLEK